MRYITIITFFLIFLNVPALGQSLLWEANLSQDGLLPQEWQGDREDYIIREGRIHLNARADRRTSLVHIPINLSKDNAWQGSLRFEYEPTTYNYTYILLAKIAEQYKERRYLTLAFGGKMSNIRLCEAVFSEQMGTYVHDKTRDIVLLATERLPLSLTQSLSYYVRLSASQELSLYLSDQDPQRAELVGETQYPIHLSSANEFGIYSAFTSGRRQHFTCTALRLIEESEVGNKEDPSSEDHEDKENRQSQTDFILSEVMANPLANSVEYLELYHCGESSASLEEYRLALSAPLGKERYYSLARHNTLLAPGGYYVLTSEPDILRATYPHLSADRLIKVKLPQLRNAGFVLRLYRGEILVDELMYDTTTWPKGLKSKRGVALERITMQPQRREFAPASKQSGYASPTYANSAKSMGAGDTSIDAEDTQELLSALIQRLEQEFKTRAVLRLYDFVGNTLNSIPADRSLEILKAIQTNPYNTLRQLTGHTQALILVVEVIDADGEEELYDLKFAFAPTR